MDWNEFFEMVRSHPIGVHDLGPPCSEEVITALESALGPLPLEVREMLAHFNGAELFIDAIPMVTLFGVSTPENPLPPAVDLLSQTSTWRQEGRSSADWVIGVSNYGGLFVHQPTTAEIQEWDSSFSKWSGKKWSYPSWREQLLAEGPEYLRA